MSRHYSQRRFHPRDIADSFFVGFGLWTVYCHLFVFSGSTFSQLVQWSFVPTALFLLFVFVGVRSPSHVPTPYPSRQHLEFHHVVRPAVLACLALIAIVFALTKFAAVSWCVSVLFVLAAMRTRAVPRTEQDQEPHASRYTLVLPVLVMAALVLSLFWQSRNWEAPFYLNMGLHASEADQRSLLGEDWLHGEPDLPPVGPYYAVHSYELLIALIGRLTGVEQITLFHHVFPRFCIAMSLIMHWLALRQLGANRRGAALGLLLACVVWISWGDAPRTLGVWTFNNLVTGKGVLVCVAVPALFYYSARFTARGDAVSLLAFWGAQISAVGLSSSGIIVAPLACAIALLAAVRLSRLSILRTTIALAPIIYIGWVSAMMSKDFHSKTALGSTKEVSSLEGLLLVVGGTGLRPCLIVGCLLALVILPTVHSSRRVSPQRLVLATMVVVLNPWTAEFLNMFVSNMWWRAFWSVPWPLLVGLAGSQLLAIPAWQTKWRFGPLIYVAITSCLVLAPQGRAVTAANFSPPWERDGSYYRDSYFDVAEAVVEEFDRADLVLGPTRVAMWLIALRDRPRLVAARPSYTGVFRPLGTEEPDARRRLQYLMDGRSQRSDITDPIHFLEHQISRLEITGIVLDENASLTRAIETAATRSGFTKIRSVQGHTLMMKSP